MQSRLIYISIGITLLFILVGVYFFYNAVLKDNTSEETNIDFIEKRNNEKSAPLSSSSSTRDKTQVPTTNHSLHNESKPKGIKNQQIVDQTLKINI